VEKTKEDVSVNAEVCANLDYSLTQLSDNQADLVQVKENKRLMSILAQKEETKQAIQSDIDEIMQ
jgi:hypothetical protein